MKILTFVIFTLCLSGCSGYKYQPDNLGEELIEEVIDDVTHGVIDPDLSPGTPEKGFSPKEILPFKKDPPVKKK